MSPGENLEPVRLLSTEALAKRWRKAPRKIKAWRDAGILPTFTDPESGRVMFLLGEIERFERGEWKAAS